jgi:hypothetical protein
MKINKNEHTTRFILKHRHMGILNIKEIRMDTNRKITILAGALYIIGFIAGILSIASAVDNSEYLIKASANANQVIFAAFFQFIMTVAYLGIAIALYPVLRKYNERLALGFLCFRIIAAVFIVIGVIILLLILTISQEYVKSGTPDLSYFQFFGGLLKTGRDLVNHVAMIISLNIGTIMFYFILFQSKLIPKWLSGWGIIGAILTITASLLVMFRLIEIITPVYIIINIPMALQELILAIWLIVKGFDKKVIASKIDNT